MRKKTKPVRAIERAYKEVTRQATSTILPSDAHAEIWSPREQRAYDRWKRDLRQSLLVVGTMASDLPDVCSACNVIVCFIEARG